MRKNSVFKALKAVFLSLGIITAMNLAFVTQASAENLKTEAFQQEKVTITGTVSDNAGTLPGVTILIKGTSEGTSTDIDGNYTLIVDKGAVLQFSFVGYKTKEIVVNKQAVINVTLEADQQQLDEVVVVGYGTQKKVNLTGAVTSVDTKALASRPVSQVGQALQGVVPGLNLSTPDLGGQLGQTMNVNIRGTGTIGKGSSASPLILIDGMEGNMNNLNPEDIENISVLKDAASTAIYGSRAANGIILVKTKAGQKGKPTVSLRYTYGVEQQPQRIPLLNARDYITLSRSNIAKFNQADLTYNGKEDQAKFLSGSFGMSTGNPRNSKNTLEFLDVYLQKYGQGYVSNLLEHEGWQTMADPVTGGQKHEVDLSISGGTEAINYYVGLRYLNQDGILRGTNYKNYSVLFNGNYKLSEAWSLSTKASLQVRDAVGGGNTVNTISRSILTPPTYRL